MMFLTPPFSQTAVAKKILSLVPSQTELLSFLELDAETIGITKFCVHPAEWFQRKSRIGGTKTADIQKILSLAPDLVLCNKEENVKEQVDQLAQQLPVYASDVCDFDDALQMIREIGVLTGKGAKAAALANDISSRFEQYSFQGYPLSAIYLIWQEPLMTIGGDSFISSMMKKAGFENLLKEQPRYPEITEQEILSLNPDVILLSSEPFPFKQKHLQSFNQAFPKSKIVLVDGEMFSWYGSRMLLAPSYFRDLRHTINNAST